MPWVRSTCGWGPREAVRNSRVWGEPIPIGGLPYSKGICTYAFQDATPADVVLDISGQSFSVFKAHIGLSDNKGSVQFQVLVDGEVKLETPVMRFEAFRTISVDVTGGREVVLRVLNGGDENASDEVGWGYPRFIQAGAQDPLEEPPTEFRSAIEANAAFFLAEVHRRVEQKELARRWFDRAAAWMDKNKPEDAKLRGYRDEAAKLLGIGEKPSTEKEQPRKPD